MPTKISWTDESWNPVMGCTPVSEGCAHCYAKRITERFGGDFSKVTLHPDRLDIPLHWRKPRMVFVPSMGDLWHDGVPLEFILAVWAVMEATPQHTYQLLTKRPGRMRALLAAPSAPAEVSQPEYERRAISDWPGYFADTEGAIWSGRRGKLRRLSPCVTSKWGHAHVSLHNGLDRDPRQVKVHRLVLRTFDREPEGDEEGRHLDGDPTNNWISNLRWGSRVDNSADRTRHGNAVTARRLMAMQVAEVRTAAFRGQAHRAIALRYGISHTQVARVVSGESWGLKPLPNVWLGVSVENQARADERYEFLRDTPAAVRFYSIEPLLGPIPKLPLDGISWCIVGGESGGPPERRLVERCSCTYSLGVAGRCSPITDCEFCHGIGWSPKPEALGWVRKIRDDCQAAGVAFWFKQWGPRAGQGTLLDDREHKEMP